MSVNAFSSYLIVTVFQDFPLFPEHSIYFKAEQFLLGLIGEFLLIAGNGFLKLVLISHDLIYNLKIQ